MYPQDKELTPFLNRTNVDSPTHHMPFFEDAHAARALAAAYDLTGRRPCLDACRRWADRIVEYHDKRIPAGAYYMNHQRAPGQDRGQWNVADSGSVGMGVLATAVRCDDPVAKARYLNSVRAFARLVIDNYLGPEGGVCNGLWPAYAGEWWCSTATFGTLMFLLHEENGEEPYLKLAMDAPSYLEKNVDMAGLPYLMYSFARQIPELRGITPMADGELKYIGDILLEVGTPNVSRLMTWEVMTWGMLSYAERLQPGGLEKGARSLARPARPQH